MLLELARARGLAHDVAGAIATFTEAAELARATGDAAGLACAALGLPEVSEGTWLDAVRGWCEEALRGLGDGDSPLKARLLAQVAHSGLFGGDARAIADAGAAALAMAERLDDPASLSIALRARQLAHSDADGNAERLVLGGRMLALGERTGDPEAVLWGRLWRFDALLQAGRVTDAETELVAVEPVVAVLRRLLPRLHLLRGRVALALGSGPLRRSPRAERRGRRDRRAGRALRCVGDRPFAADRDSGGHRGRPGRPGVAAHAPVPDGADGRVDAGADDPPAPRPGRARRGAGVVREPARGRRRADPELHGAAVGGHARPVAARLRRRADRRGRAPGAAALRRPAPRRRRRRHHDDGLGAAGAGVRRDGGGQARRRRAPPAHRGGRRRRRGARPPGHPRPPPAGGRPAGPRPPVGRRRVHRPAGPGRGGRRADGHGSAAGPDRGAPRRSRTTAGCSPAARPRSPSWSGAG